MYKDCDCCLFQSGRLAQLVERLPYKQNVGGSIPSAPTIIFSNLKKLNTLICLVFFAFLLFLFFIYLFYLFWLTLSFPNLIFEFKLLLLSSLTKAAML